MLPSATGAKQDARSWAAPFRYQHRLAAVLVVLGSTRATELRWQEFPNQVEDACAGLLPSVEAPLSDSSSRLPNAPLFWGRFFRIYQTS